MHKAPWAQGFSAPALLESLGPATLDWSSAARLTLLGVAVVRSWQFSRVGDSLGEHFDTMKSIACRMRQRAQTLGYLSYPIFQVARLSQFVQIDCSPENRAMTELCQVSLSQGRFAVQGAQMSFAELLREFGLTGCIAQIPLLGPLADRIVQGAWSCLGVLPVHERVHRARLIIPSQPPRRQLLMWIREHRNRHDDPSTLTKQESSVRRPLGFVKHVYDPVTILIVWHFHTNFGTRPIVKKRYIRPSRLISRTDTRTC